MKPWTSWLVRLGLAGSCLTLVGCGGGGVAAPTTGALVATSNVSGEPASPPSDAQQEVAPAQPAADEASSSPARTSTDAATDPTVAARSGEEPAAEGQPAAGAETGSATNDMLALTEKAAPTTTVAEPASPTTGPGVAAPASPSTPPPAPVAIAPAPAPAPQPAPAPPASRSYPALAEATPTPAPAPAPNPQPAPAPAPASAGDDNGIMGGDADVNVDVSRPGPFPAKTFQKPWTAAAAFLAALKAKDAEKLAQSTALRAPREAGPKYAKVFSAILEQSLAPEDIDELAKKFEGMKIYDHNQPKSTGEYGIIVGGMKKGNFYNRTLYMRKEKAGWKVVDISGERKFEKPIIVPMPSMRGGGAHHGGRR